MLFALCKGFVLLSFFFLSILPFFVLFLSFFLSFFFCLLKQQNRNRKSKNRKDGYRPSCFAGIWRENMADQDGGQGWEYSYKMGLKGLHDSYFTSLYAAPYLGLLTNFASCFCSGFSSEDF